MYVLGAPITIQVDDWLPHWGSTYQTLFAKVQRSGDKSTWMVILEKAFAKMNGNYAQLIGGFAERGVNSLTGFPSYTFALKNETDASIIQKLQDHDNDSDIITASSNYSAYGDSATVDNGIVNSHAYTVLGVDQVDFIAADSTGAMSTQLIRLRNPWSRESYKGAWSDGDSRWNNVTQASKDAIGLTNDTYDGVFFIDIANFKSSFNTVSINYDLSDYHRSYFLRLSDTTTGAESPRQGWYCASSTECVRHSFKIRSNVTQELHISTHLHDKRTYPTDCSAAMQWTGIQYKFGTSHSVQIGWIDGPYHFTPRTIQAGDEWEIAVELPWYNDELTKDFSLVALASVEEVEIVHDRGLESDHWPLHGLNSAPLDPFAEENRRRELLDAWLANLSYSNSQGTCGERFFEDTIEGHPVLAVLTDCDSDMLTTFSLSAELFNGVNESLVVSSSHDEATGCTTPQCAFTLTPSNSRVGLMLNDSWDGSYAPTTERLA